MSDSFATPWTVVCQAPLPIGFPRQEYWSELPFPSLTDIPKPGIKPESRVLAGGFLTTEPPGKLKLKLINSKKEWQLLTNLTQFNTDESRTLSLLCGIFEY